MADENRIATFEWLNDNLYEFRKGTPPINKKGVTKTELITNYNVDESLLTTHTDKRLVTRQNCAGFNPNIPKTYFDSYVTSSAYNNNTIYCTSPVIKKYNDETIPNVIGINNNGYRNKNFNVTTHELHNRTISVQYDGKIIVASYTKIVRYNQDGTIDYTFTSKFATNTEILCMKPQTDGKILVGGFITEYNGQQCPSGIIRLLNNGDIDHTFNSGNSGVGTQIGYTKYVKSINIKNDIIYIGGSFGKYNDVFSPLFVKLNMQGEILKTNDVIYSHSNYTEGVVSIDFIDNNIVVGGEFQILNLGSTYDPSYSNLAMLTENLTHILTFKNAINSINVVKYINNEIYVGSDTRLYKIDKNSGQTITYEPNIVVYDINKIDNNSTIVVGRFTNYKSKKCNNIVMIDNNLDIIQSF